MNYRWTGLVSSSWAATGNWVNDSGTVPGTIPTSGDTVILDRACTNGLAGGDYSSTPLTDFKVGPAYNKTIGSSATPLTIACSGSVIYDAKKALASYIYGSSTGTGITAARIENINTSLTMGGTIHSYSQQGGVNAVIVPGTLIDTQLSLGSSQSAASVAITIPSGCTLPTNVDSVGATVVCSTPVVNLKQIGGRWTQLAGDITTYTGYSGIFDYQGGNIGTVYLYNTLDCHNSVATRVITNCTAYPGHCIDLTDTVEMVTFTNPVDCQADSLVTKGMFGRKFTF